MTMFTAAHMPYFLATTVLMVLSPILVTLSQDSEGNLNYSIPSTTLLTELIKIGISFSMMALQPASTRTTSLKSVMHYVVPAIIYFVNNNLTFVILQHVDPTTFQLISQLKIIFTGLLFRAILKRHLHMHQYFAITLVACGTATSQIPTCPSCNPEVAALQAAAGEARTPWWGFLMMVFSCFLSALGGIYSEKLLKGNSTDSIHWQNVQLYAWGILFNGVGTVAHDARLIAKGFFSGYNYWTWSVILNNALNGLAISALLKFSDNIMRVFAHATAIVLTIFANIMLFGVHPTPQVIVAFFVIAISMMQYNTSAPEDAHEEDEPLIRKEGERDSLCEESTRDDEMLVSHRGVHVSTLPRA